MAGVPPNPAQLNLTARQLRRINGTATVAWVLLVVPTVLWWRQSILWIALMSVWANVVSHYSAWQAARAEYAATETPPAGSTPAPGPEHPHPDQGG